MVEVWRESGVRMAMISRWTRIIMAWRRMVNDGGRMKGKK